MLDYFFYAYLLWCFIRGIMRGAGKEVEGLLFSLLILGALLGLFVFSQLSGFIKTTLQMTLSDSGFLISITSFVLAIIIFFMLRNKISGYIDAQFSTNTSRKGGALLGLVRGSVVISIMVILLNYAPFGLFKNTLDNSFVARQIITLAGEGKK
ncbi:MAG: CvpA family protein [Gammaproteobacteria bacterium]|nr:CvpA family protein [Gammaproteobacteria bacterium]